MEPLHILALALLQGITEFLPISSSAHLVLVPSLLGWEDQGLDFDIAVHAGTLAAVVAYFRKEIAALLQDGLASLKGGRLVGEGRLLLAIIIGTVPVGLCGLFFKDFVEAHLRSVQVIAWATLGFGVLLGLADSLGRKARDEHGITLRDALVIGLFQALALIPGTSRSGITLTAGLLLGLSRPAAARFAFLLAIPVILLAGGLEALEVVAGKAELSLGVLLSGALISGISAFACIHAFLRLLERLGLWPFVLYRLGLGAFLLAL